MTGLVGRVKPPSRSGATQAPAALLSQPLLPPNTMQHVGAKQSMLARQQAMLPPRPAMEHSNSTMAIPTKPPNPH